MWVPYFLPFEHFMVLTWPFLAVAVAVFGYKVLIGNKTPGRAQADKRKQPKRRLAGKNHSTPHVSLVRNLGSPISHAGNEKHARATKENSSSQKSKSNPPSPALVRKKAPLNLEQPAVPAIRHSSGTIPGGPLRAFSYENVMEIEHSRTSFMFRLKWQSPPETVLLIKKWRDTAATEALSAVAGWLVSGCGITVLVDAQTAEELPHLRAYNEEDLDGKGIDLVITLGGDGTLLHASSLFSRACPPVMCFSMGSLGFLTPFEMVHYKRDIKKCLESKFYVNLRTRLSCYIVRSNGDITDELPVLNEVVIDRGTSNYLTTLDCYCDDQLVTTVQADGIIIGTTTGSTAYSLSAGGSLIHPTIPAILITPICPHSLSFRPIVLPESTTIKILVPSDSRSSVWISFDGQKKVELEVGDAVIVNVSKWPVPDVSSSYSVSSWMQRLAQNLNWNVRHRQLGFTPKAKRKGKSRGRRKKQTI